MSIQNTPLGKEILYPTQYQSTLLCPVARNDARKDLFDLAKALPFTGIDVWNAYEVSWLNQRGKPQIAIAHFIVPAESPFLIESKSLKLYLNSLQTMRADLNEIKQLMQNDLSACAGAAVQVVLRDMNQFAQYQLRQAQGISLDRLDVEVEHYHPHVDYLRADRTQSSITEQLYSQLFKSNCPVTGQPDWATISIDYHGAPIDHAGLLKYLISYREHSGFHEHCVEKIFIDILEQCKPERLAVGARYTRRGGIDINPWRTNYTEFNPSFIAFNFRDTRQ